MLDEMMVEKIFARSRNPLNIIKVEILKGKETLQKVIAD